MTDRASPTHCQPRHPTPIGSPSGMGKLAIGLQAGLTNWRADWTKLDFENPQPDPSLMRHRITGCPISGWCIIQSREVLCRILLPHIWWSMIFAARISRMIIPIMPDVSTLFPLCWWVIPSEWEGPDVPPDPVGEECRLVLRAA